MTRKGKFRPLFLGNSLRCFHSLPMARSSRATRAFRRRWRPPSTTISPHGSVWRIPRALPTELLGTVFGGPGKTSIRAAFGMYYTSIEDLNLFYEVADAPFGLYWSTPTPVMFDEPFRIRTNGQSLGQRFPFTSPIPAPRPIKTLPFGIYEPFNYYPGYYIHNGCPTRNTSISRSSAN